MLNLIDAFIIIGKHFPMLNLIDAFIVIGKHFPMLNLIDAFIIIWKHFPISNISPYWKTLSQHRMENSKLSSLLGTTNRNCIGMLNMEQLHHYLRLFPT